MRSALQHYFSRRAGIAVLAGALAGPGSALAQPPQAAGKAPGGAIDLVSMMKTDTECATSDDLAQPKNPVQSYLSDLFARAAIMLDPADVKNDSFSVCLSLPLMRAMNTLLGVYNSEKDVYSLNPVAASEASRILTTVHEMRHRAQAQLNLVPASDANIPVYERIAMNFAIEADARLQETMMAWTMNKRGHAEYAQALKSDPLSGPLYLAYEQAMQKTPDDQRKAMRAVIYAFLGHGEIRRVYAGMIAAGIPENSYRPDLPRQTILTEANMMALGQRGGIGNYMDRPLIAALLKGFTAEDYRAVMKMLAPPTVAPGIRP